LDAVVNLSGVRPFVVSGGPLHVQWRIDGDDLPDLTQLHELAEYVTSLVVAGKRVLVRCEDGLNRASLLTGFVLYLMGHDPREIPTELRERLHDKKALSNPRFFTYLASLPEWPAGVERYAESIG